MNLTRTYDVCAFSGQKLLGDTLLAQTMFADGGLVCTGVVKGAQEFVIEFQTEKDSMPYLPGRGCDFMTKLRLGYLQHESDVFAAFALAAADVLDNLAADHTANTPDDERIVAAVLVGVRIYPGFCLLRIVLTTAAGDAREVTLPIPTIY
jgi:hypothetical protein